VPTLMVLAALEDGLVSGSTHSFRCTLLDELRYSSRIGENIVIAEVHPTMERGYSAIGRLKGFATALDGTTSVVIEKIQPFPSLVAFSWDVPQDKGMAELDDGTYTRIMEKVLGQADEMASSYEHAQVAEVTEQLKKIYRRRCNFSDVTTRWGRAYIIRPLELGGKMHISNFLFLDPEPGELFTAFAWTVGQKFEIIIDEYSVGPELSATCNSTGHLALTELVADWPDREALAWHRQQFFDRRR
jgi:hypothetical protein